MTPKQYRELFDQAYAFYNSDAPFNIDRYFDPETPENEFDWLHESDLPLDRDVAGDMLKAKVSYWEHDGWVAACAQALESMVYRTEFERAGELSSWLMAIASKGVGEQYPQLVKYAVGDFPEADVKRWQEQGQWWRERQAQSRAFVPSGVGDGVDLQTFIQQ